MRKYVLVALGGGLGSVLRFGITQWMAPLPVWPFTAVLFINFTGCFLISFLNFLSDPAGEIYLGPNSRIFLLVGICGGYTTFSTFSLISFNAARQNALPELCLNISLSHLLCLLAVWFGAIAAAHFPRIVVGLVRWLRSWEGSRRC
jgi:fluoride exporter